MPFPFELLGGPTPYVQPGQGASEAVKMMQDWQTQGETSKHNRALEENAQQNLALQSQQAENLNAYRTGELGIHQEENRRSAQEWQDKQDLALADRAKTAITNLALAHSGGNQAMMSSAAGALPKGYRVRVDYAPQTQAAEAATLRAAQTGQPPAPPPNPSVTYIADPTGTYEKGSYRAPQSAHGMPAGPGPGSALGKYLGGLGPPPTAPEPSGGLPAELGGSPPEGQPAPSAVTPPTAAEQGAPQMAPPPLGMMPSPALPPPAALGNLVATGELKPGPKTGALYHLEHLDASTGIWEHVTTFDHDQMMGEAHDRIRKKFEDISQNSPDPVSRQAAYETFQLIDQEVGSGVPLDGKDGLLARADSMYVDLRDHMAAVSWHQKGKVGLGAGGSPKELAAGQARFGKLDDRVENVVAKAENAWDMKAANDGIARAREIQGFLSNPAQGSAAQAKLAIDGIITIVHRRGGNKEEFNRLEEAGGPIPRMQRAYENWVGTGQATPEVKTGITSAAQEIIDTLSTRNQKMADTIYNQLMNLNSTMSDDEAQALANQGLVAAGFEPRGTTKNPEAVKFRAKFSKAGKKTAKQLADEL